MIRVKRVEPVVIAVKSLNEAIPFFQNIFGGKFAATHPEQDHLLAQFVLGDSVLELVEPTDRNGPVAKFLERRGQGVMAVHLQVDDLEEATTELESKGLRVEAKQVLDPPFQSHKGTKWYKLAFTHPKDTFGVLLGIVETRNM